MTHVRIHDDTKERLEYLGGQDYSIDDVIRILLKRFIVDEESDDDDDDQRTIEDFMDDDEE
jgi:hypothetical protein